MRKRILLVIGLVLFFSSSVPLLGADWPRFRGPDGTGVSSETSWKPESLPKGPKVAWEANVGNGYSSVAVKDGKVYTMGNNGKTDTVYCLNESDGKEVWRHMYPSKGGKYPGPRCTPAVDGTSVYTISYSGLVSCLGTAKGNVIWKQNVSDFGAKLPTWGYATSPVIDGNMVLLNVCTYGVALDKKNGKKVWSSPGGVSGYATPVIFDRSGKKCVAMFGQKALYGVDMKTGKELFRYPWETSYDVNAADPIFSGGKMFISSGYKRGSALLSVASGGAKKVWEKRDMANHFGTCLLIKGHLYGISGNTGRGSLMCVDFKTGRVKWSEKTGFGGWTAAGDKLIVLTEKGVLIVAKADPSRYQEIARVKALQPKGKCWQMPVLANGRIYCRSSGGQLVCIDASK